MKITISSQAEKRLKKISKIDQFAIAQKIRQLSSNFTFVTNVEVIKGFKGGYRVRVGDFRIVFKKTSKEVYIVLIGHRKDVYQLLKRLLG